MAAIKFYTSCRFLLWLSVCLELARTAELDDNTFDVPNLQDDDNVFPFETRDRQKREVQESSCVPVISDDQTYYDMTVTKGAISDWIEIDNEKQLSPDDENYPLVNLPWGFPFYGHEVKHIFPSTLGMLSMSELPEIRPTHFISPFFINFINYTSGAYFHTTDEKFVVELRDVFHLNHADFGPCWFQVICYRDGTIKFLYKKLPPGLAPKTYMIGLHGGVSVHIPGPPKFRAVTNYQPLNVNQSDVVEGTMVKFSPKSYCGLSKDSQLCEAENVTFFCKNCNVSSHCVDEINNAVEEWLISHCSDKVPEKCKPGDHDDTGGIPTITIVLAVVVVTVLVLISATGGWCYYAYSHPETPSGRWLIEHPPSQMFCLKKTSNEDDKTTVGIETMQK